MSPDILLKIETVLKASNLLDNSQVTLLCSKFENYKSGHLVFPNMVKRHLGVSLKGAYNILNQLVDANILKLCFQLQCKHEGCYEVYRYVFEEINEIPKNITCEHCGCTFDILKDTKVIFKVR